MYLPDEKFSFRFYVELIFLIKSFFQNLNKKVLLIGAVFLFSGIRQVMDSRIFNLLK